MNGHDAASPGPDGILILSFNTVTCRGVDRGQEVNHFLGQD